MKIIGLTGGIGSGKSTVAALLERRGARIIDADRLARAVVEPGQPAWQEIAAEFGPDALNPDQTLNRERLAALVFADEPRRKRLNQITHPRIGELMVRLLDQYRKQGAVAAVIDAALLFESAATNWIRPVIVVAAGEEVKLDRVCARDGVDRESVRKRMRAQWTDEQRRERADYVIDNSRGLPELEEQVEKVWQEILSRK